MRIITDEEEQRLRDELAQHKLIRTELELIHDARERLRAALAVKKRNAKRKTDKDKDERKAAVAAALLALMRAAGLERYEPLAALAAIGYEFDSKLPALYRGAALQKAVMRDRGQWKTGDWKRLCSEAADYWAAVSNQPGYDYKKFQSAYGEWLDTQEGKALDTDRLAKKVRKVWQR